MQHFAKKGKHENTASGICYQNDKKMYTGHHFATANSLLYDRMEMKLKQLAGYALK